MSVVVSDVDFARCIRYRRRWQNQVDHAVPFDQGNGIDVDHVLGLQPELARDSKCGRILGIEIENCGCPSCTLTNDVDLASACRGIQRATRLPQGLAQAEAPIATHGQCQWSQDLSHEKDLGILPIRDSDGVFAFQRNAITVIPGLSQLDQIDGNGLAIPNKRHGRSIARRGDATSSIMASFSVIGTSVKICEPGLRTSPST